jgi:hypothetical protein
MDQQARILQRLRAKKARQQGPASQAIYLGYNASAGGHQVRQPNGSVRLADTLTLGAVALDQEVQFVGGSFDA